MDRFISENLKAFEAEFSSQERLTLERERDLICEFKSAIRAKIGGVWLGMTQDPKQAVPATEVEHALRELADEIRQWKGLKTHAEEDRERMMERTKTLRAVR